MATASRRGTQAIGHVLGELFARRGLARLRGHSEVEDVWRRTIGQPGAKYTRVGSLRNGVLEVLVANSVLLQELVGFQRQSLLDKLKDSLGTQMIRNIRFRLDPGR